MKKILSFTLIFVGFIPFSLYIIDNVFYPDKLDFLSPLEMQTLSIRNDRLGEGRFGAERKNSRLHNGLDISASIGTPVRAVKKGWAVSKLDRNGYGNYVVIYHSAGLATLYAHLECTDIRWIRRVRQGDIIGWVGKSGNARYKGIKPHLHFEVRKNGISLDPLKGYLE